MAPPMDAMGFDPDCDAPPAAEPPLVYQTAPPPTRREVIFPRVVECIEAVTPRMCWPRDDATHLFRDLWLNGEGLMRLGELLEDEFRLVLLPAELIDLALQGATVGRLMSLLGKHDA